MNVFPSLGAWAGSWALADSARAVGVAKAIGLRRLDIIVNDLAAARAPTAFAVRDEARIAGLANACHEAEIEPHFLTWVMPHERFLRQMFDTLLPMAYDLKIHSVVLDAEEPWTQARAPMDYDAAGALVGELIAPASVEFGKTSIGYASTQKLGRLAAACDYLVPQCYSTSTSGLDPRNVVSRFSARWRDVFPERRVVAGLAAYRQENILVDEAPVTTAAAMHMALDDLVRAELDEAIYWQLKSMASNKGELNTCGRAIRDWLQKIAAAS